MKATVRGMLASVNAEMDGADLQYAQDLLSDPNADLLQSSPTNEKVDQLLPTLRARLSNSARSGKYIAGLKAVIRHLERLPADEKVLGYAVVSSRAAGNYYFIERNHMALGATIVNLDRPGRPD